MTWEPPLLLLLLFLASGGARCSRDTVQAVNLKGAAQVQAQSDIPGTRGGGEGVSLHFCAEIALHLNVRGTSRAAWRWWGCWFVWRSGGLLCKTIGLTGNWKLSEPLCYKAEVERCPQTFICSLCALLPLRSPLQKRHTYCVALALIQFNPAIWVTQH